MHVVIDQIPARLFVLDTPIDDDDRDDMLSYQEALLDYGMIIINFWDSGMLFLRAAYHLIWNRFTKSRADAGGNIPLDLDLEFKNKMVKEFIKKLGLSATRQVIRQDLPLP